MAINFKDGVILGADSRTTTGAYIANRVTDKLTQVHDTIWCCRSGSAADTQAVADIVSYHLNMYGVMNAEAPTTQVAASLFQELCYENKDALRSVPGSLGHRSIRANRTTVRVSFLPDGMHDTEVRCSRYR
jgi:20S proteasome subunit beta 1